ncbi:hypothetical protein OROGR_000870 [Orobanche gracilis]
MDYSSQRVIFIALLTIMMSTISPSLGRKEKSEVEKDLRDLCSHTDKSNECWRIIEPKLSEFSSTDPKIVADVVLDLAKEKGVEIYQELTLLYEYDTDDKTKKNYLSCSDNYKDAVVNLILARENLESDDCRNIPAQIDDTIKDLEVCELEFDKDSFGPTQIGNMMKEFRVYVDIVKVATDRLLNQN